MKYKSQRNRRFKGLEEWHRTIVLFVLLAIGGGVVFWTNTNVNNNFVDQFQAASQPSPQPPAEVEQAHDLVRSKYVANGRRSGHQERSKDSSFVVNANGLDSYSVSVIPDSGKTKLFLVSGNQLYAKEGDNWLEPIELSTDKLGFAATDYTYSNETVNIFWKKTNIQPEPVACGAASCGSWKGKDDAAGTEYTMLVDEEGRLVRLEILESSGVSTAIDYNYTTLPEVAPKPPGV